MARSQCLAQAGERGCVQKWQQRYTDSTGLAGRWDELNLCTLSLRNSISNPASVWKGLPTTSLKQSPHSTDDQTGWTSFSACVEQAVLTTSQTPPLIFPTRTVSPPPPSHQHLPPHQSPPPGPDGVLHLYSESGAADSSAQGHFQLLTSTIIPVSKKPRITGLNDYRPVAWSIWVDCHTSFIHFIWFIILILFVFASMSCLICLQTNQTNTGRETPGKS